MRIEGREREREGDELCFVAKDKETERGKGSHSVAAAQSCNHKSAAPNLRELAVGNRVCNGEGNPTPTKISLSCKSPTEPARVMRDICTTILA